MKKIRAITYPKSGQHLMFEVLLKYFSKNIEYNSSSRRLNGGQMLQAGKFVFCEKNIHCNQTPCSEPATNFQVMHNCNKFWYDHPEVNYLFLYRNPIYCILSLANHGVEDSYTAGWKEMDYLVQFSKKIKEWKEWAYKWVIGNTCKNVLNVLYEDIIKNPEKEFTKIIKYIEPDKEINIEHLKEVIKFMKIEPKHQLTNFKYYKEMEGFLKYLEKSVEPELKILNIPRIF